MRSPAGWCPCGFCPPLVTPSEAEGSACERDVAWAAAFLIHFSPLDLFTVQRLRYRISPPVGGSLCPYAPNRAFFVLLLHFALSLLPPVPSQPGLHSFSFSEFSILPSRFSLFSLRSSTIIPWVRGIKQEYAMPNNNPKLRKRDSARLVSHTNPCCPTGSVQGVIVHKG